MSEFNQLQAQIQTLNTQWQAWVGQAWSCIWRRPLPPIQPLAGHAFFLRELAEQAKYLMSDAEESLAAELEFERDESVGAIAADGNIASDGGF